jgi:hypothetical protein
MSAAFETGEPHTGTQLKQALSRVVAEGTAYLATLTDGQFFEPQGKAWSPSEHVRHLRKSSAPVAMALKLPRLLLRIRFGLRSGPSRSFPQVQQTYLGKLAEGADAGSYAPRRDAPPSNPADRRREIMNAWAAVTVDLTNAMAGWNEPDTDRYQLPHPILGLLSVREMLIFTVYHTAHHLRRVQERARGEAKA